MLHISGKDKNCNCKRRTHPNVHCSTIYNSQDMEAPKCPLIDEWIKKVWYTYTLEYYSAVKRTEILASAATWVDLEIVIISEISQTKAISYDATYMQITLCKMPGWMKHKLKSRFQGEIWITSDMQMTPPLWQKRRRTKEPLDESERGEWKRWLKARYSEN